MSFAPNDELLARILPEVAVGGYSARDGTIEFYGRIRALIGPEMRVLDYGAGRGAWFEDDPSPYRHSVRLLRGSVAEVIGCDIENAVLGNRALDRALVLKPGERLPLNDAAVDIIIADYVFEHVADPAELAAELGRVLKPGGWICARTPTKYNYVSLMARLVSSARHARWLRIVQPGRKTEDVFPTVYRLNTRASIRRYFGDGGFEDHTYIYCFEPQYFFGSYVLYRLFEFIHWLLPARLHGNLYVFLRKR